MFNKRDEVMRRDSSKPGGYPNVSGMAQPASVTPTAPQSASMRADAAVVERKTEETKGSRLIVGPDIKLKGAEITDCDTLVVEGRVEASMDSRVIQIAENGAYVGTVGIDIAEIRGRFDGELTARKQLVIHATGKVSGKIRYGRIVIEDGGELSGDVSTLTASASVKAITATAKDNRVGEKSETKPGDETLTNALKAANSNP